MNHRKVNELHRETHKTRLYKIWTAMRERCNRQNHSHFDNYGGRGIKVCPEWDDYIVFREWAKSHGYSNDLTLDRIDSNGNYEPDNCRWVTMKAQNRNRRNNKILEYKGQKYVMSELAERSGISVSTFKERIRHGWSVEDAVEKPVQLRMRGYRPSKKTIMGV